MDTQPNNTPLVTGVYWRKNLWNGAATVPVILAHQDGVLEMRDESSTIFSHPLSSVRAKISLWGTLTITVGDEKYDFVGSGAALSRRFSPDQQAHIESQNLTVATDLVKGGTVGAVAGTVIGAATTAGAGVAAQAAGVGAMVAGYFVGLEAIKKWQSFFIERKLLTKGNYTSRRSVALIMISIFVVVFAIVGVLSALYDKS